MRRSNLAGLLLALAVPPVLVLSTACREPQAPGTRIGTFEIMGALEENTCGQGFSPSPVVVFTAELRRSGNTAYWRMGNTGPRSEGRIEDDGDFLFRTQSQIDGWAADPVNGIPACRFVQTETIEGHVSRPEVEGDAGISDAGDLSDAGADSGADAGVEARVLSATNSIEIGVVPGFDCSLSLISTGAGGQFPQLPCRARYELEGGATE